MRDTRSVGLVAIVLVVLVAAPVASDVAVAQSAPSAYYGPAVTDDGTALPDGTTIVAVVDGTVRDRITVSSGTYGGGAPLDEKLRVSQTNETVRFYVETDDGTRIEANRTDSDPTEGTEEFPLSFPDGVTSSGSNFEVTALDPGDTTAFEDETVTVTATVTNQVQQGTETVALRIDGTERATRTVTLDSDESRTVEFAVDAASLASGEHTYAVTTENDERTASLTVRSRSPYFAVSGLSPEATTVGQAERFDVSGTVTNDGSARGTQTIALAVDGDAIEKTTLTLAPEESQTVTFTDVNATQIGSGSHSHAVETTNDSQSGSLTVEGTAPATFAVTDLDPETTTVRPGTSVDLTATVANTGTQAGSQQLRLRVDGDQYVSRSLSLAGGERQTVTITLGTEGRSTGDHAYSFVTDDDDEGGTVTLSEAVTPTPTPTVTTAGSTPATTPDEESTEPAPTATSDTAATTATDTTTNPTRTEAATTTAATTPQQTERTPTPTDEGGGGLPVGLIQTVTLGLGAVIVVVYGVLKALAIYLGY